MQLLLTVVVYRCRLDLWESFHVYPLAEVRVCMRVSEREGECENSKKRPTGDGLFVHQLIVICSIPTNCSNLSVLFLLAFVCVCPRAHTCLRTCTQSLDGFVFVVSHEGRFLYISETVSIYLGHTHTHSLPSIPLYTSAFSHMYLSSSAHTFKSLPECLVSLSLSVRVCEREREYLTALFAHASGV